MLVVLAVCACACTQPATAQDKPVPPPTSTGTETAKPARKPLPGITLSQYVITGTDEIGFPLDAKEQPELLRTGEFTERAGRGERERRFAPTGAIRRPLDQDPLAGTGRRLYARAGFGRFTTPYAEAWYGDRFEKADIAAHAMYEQSDGHAPRRDYAKAGFDVAGGTWLSPEMPALLANSRVEGTLSIGLRKYGAYADRFAMQTPAIGIRRNLLEAAWGARLVSRSNPLCDHSAGFEMTHTLLKDDATLTDMTTMRDSLALGRFMREEHVVGFTAAAIAHVFEHSIATSLDARLSLGATTKAYPDRPVHIRATGATVFALSEQTRLDAMLHVYVFRGSETATSARLYPRLVLTHRLDENLAVYGAWLPSVDRITLSELFARNPYASAVSELRHEDVPVRMQIGGSWDDRASASARIYLEYVYATSMLRFTRLPAPLGQSFDAGYTGGTTITSLNGEFNWNIVPGGRLQGHATVRRSYVHDLDRSIPAMPGVEAGAMYVHTLPIGLELRGSVDLGAARTDEQSALPGFLMLGVEAEYAITPSLGAFISVRNAFNQEYEYWRGFSERPLFVLAGITAHL